jgi:type IV secretion system protein TrbL
VNPDVGILTTALKTFLNEFLAGYGRIHDSAKTLLHLLGMIDLGLAALFALWARNDDNFSWIAQKVFAYGFWIFLVAQWITVVPMVINGFIWTGLRAGGSTLTVEQFTDPSAIAGMGLTATEPLWQHVRDYGWSFWKHGLDILLVVILGAIIEASFFLIAIEVFVFFLQFYIFAVLTTILLPFGINRYTSWVADNCMSSLIAHGIKVMVLAMVTSVVFPLIQKFTVAANPTWAQMTGMAVGMVALALLCWIAPQKAVATFTHGPQLSAGMFAASAASAALMMKTAGGFAARQATQGARTGAAELARRRNTPAPRSSGVRKQTA